MDAKGTNRLSPEYALLGFLYNSPGYGYELHRRLQEEFAKTWHFSQSQTYSILQRLVAQGIVDSTLIEQGKHPARQQLHISALGRERFEAWLRHPTRPSVHALRVEFITRLYFTRLYFPEQLDEMISNQVEVVKTNLAQLSQQLDDLTEQSTVNTLALELRIDLLTSALRWLGHCQQVANSE